MVQITIFFMSFRDVQCALHDRNMEKVMFAHFMRMGEIQQFFF